MQAFAVGDADYNLPFRIEPGPELEPPEPVGIVVTFAQNRRRRSLSYKEWFTPPIKRIVGNGEPLPNSESSFHAHSLARGALLSTHQLLTMIPPGRLHAGDSNVAKKSSK